MGIFRNFTSLFRVFTSKFDFFAFFGLKLAKCTSLWEDFVQNVRSQVNFKSIFTNLCKFQLGFLKFLFIFT
jgi:hypothetical protein